MRKHDSNMQINVEFLAGTSIEDAIQEAKRKAEMLDVVYVCFMFNDVKFSIGRDADVYEAMQAYRENWRHVIFS